MIRKMMANDLSAVTIIDEELFQSPWNKEQFLYEMEENAYANLFVLEEDGKIIGYIDYWITFEIAQLAKIAIDQSFQGKGYASILMKHMIKHCEEAMCENISLEVRVSNAQAIALYEHYDFMEVAIRKGYYQDGVDAKLMVKALGGNYV